MRLWPRSIASRTALVLIAGVLTLLWAGAMVWWLSVAKADGPPGSRVAFESVASVAAMVDRLPPGARAAALRGATTDALKLAWSTTRPTRTLRGSSWEVRWAARQLKRSLAARGLSTVEVGVPAERTRGAGRNDAPVYTLTTSPSTTRRSDTTSRKSSPWPTPPCKPTIS